MVPTLFITEKCWLTSIRPEYLWYMGETATCIYYRDSIVGRTEQWGNTPMPMLMLTMRGGAEGPLQRELAARLGTSLLLLCQMMISDRITIWEILLLFYRFDALWRQTPLIKPVNWLWNVFKIETHSPTESNTYFRKHIVLQWFIWFRVIFLSTVIQHSYINLWKRIYFFSSLI